MEYKPDKYYLECFWHNSQTAHWSGDKELIKIHKRISEEFVNFVKETFCDFNIVCVGSQNGFGFAYVHIELDNTEKDSELISLCNKVAEEFETTVEFLSIVRYIKTI